MVWYITESLFLLSLFSISLNQKIGVEKPIKLIEFILSLLAFLALLATGWVSINKTVSAHDERLNSLEQWKVDFQKRFDDKTDKILDKIDGLKDAINKKQDRNF